MGSTDALESIGSGIALELQPSIGRIDVSSGDVGQVAPVGSREGDRGIEYALWAQGAGGAR